VSNIKVKRMRRIATEHIPAWRWRQKRCVANVRSLSRARLLP
jgi:hypothetical protein